MMRLDYYVRAFYDLNYPETAVSAYQEILSFNELLQFYPKLKNITVYNKDVMVVLFDTLKDHYSELFLNWIKVLIEDRHLRSFKRITQIYLSLLIKDQLYFVVDVKSAHPLSNQTQEKILKLVQDNYGLALEIDYEIDPNLVMGLVISINHQVIDLTALGQLKHLASEVLQ